MEEDGIDAPKTRRLRSACAGGHPQLARSAFMEETGLVDPEANQLVEHLGKRFSENALDWTLRAMSFAVSLNKELRQDIREFHGRYMFRIKDTDIVTSIVFDNGRMQVSDRKIDDVDVALTFKNARAFFDLVLSPNSDVVGALLSQDIAVDGNLNYIDKFVYMARRLQRMAQARE